MHKVIALLFILVSISMTLPTLAQDSCEGTTVLDNRVGLVDYGRVTLGGSSNRVRAEPSTDAEVLFSMLPGQVFFVSEIAECTDDIVWLHVDVNGQTGWTAESILDVGYFVEPLVGLQTITDTLSFNIGALDLTFSRDGQTVYALQDNGTVQAISIDGTLETLIFETDKPILGFEIDHNDNGYATIHEDGVTLWNLNFDSIQTIEPMQLTSIDVAELSPDWQWVGLGGCITSTEDGCPLGATEIININTGEHFVFEEEDTVADLAFLMRDGMGRVDSPIKPFLLSIVTASGQGRAFDLIAGEEYFTMSRSDGDRVYTMDWDATSLSIYGVCQTFDDTGDCIEGQIRGLSWFSGGGRGVFDDFASAVTDVILSPTSTSWHRLIGLGQGEIVIMYDYDPLAVSDERIQAVQEFDDISPHVMALSPDGSVLAIANDSQLMLYDVSVPVDN